MYSKLNSYKDIKLFIMILNILKKVVGVKCNFVCVSTPGSSPSKVYMFKDDNDRIFAVKLCDKRLARVSLLKEAENYKVLLPHLKEHLPRIIYTNVIKNYEIMISESKGIDNMYSSMISNKKTIEYYFVIWKDILVTIMNMWKNTMNYNYQPEKNPRKSKNRIERIKKGVYDILQYKFKIDNFFFYPVVINGIEYISLDETFKEIYNIGLPRFGITCHGDPQPSNIVIDNKNKWYLVDWEWSGKNHDFRIMFSHLFGWWPTRMISLKNVTDIEIKNNKIYINYKIVNNSIVKLFQKESYKQLKKIFDITISDNDDINRFLSLLYLGDVRFLEIWGKKEYLPLLIGEAVKTANYIKDRKIKKINQLFTFMGVYEK